MTAADIVQSYLGRNYSIITWPLVGDQKGPREPDWPRKKYSFTDYSEKHRVGILTGAEVSPGQFIHDVDIDWAQGAPIALKMLPATNFVFGRASKQYSHCFYYLPEGLPSVRYEDVDGTCLIELRGTKSNGELGLQTMVPPSIWSKGTLQELLIFIKEGEPSLIESAAAFKQRVCYSAIGMLLARNFGHNGFGHETRLAWSGFLLRAGVNIQDLVIMGEAISMVCNNLEIADVRRVVESTAKRLGENSSKVVGGPRLAQLIGNNGLKAITLINEWLGRDKDFVRDDKGKIVKESQENIKRALSFLDVQLSYHQFAEKMLIETPSLSVRNLDDASLESLWLRIDSDYQFRPTFQFYEKVVKSVAREHSFHTVKDYLTELKWDGQPRLDTWLCEYGQAPDNEYTRAVSSIVLIAAVRRITQPGCKYDEMLVLESPQGMNKSSALRALCSNSEWFSDDLPLNVDSKQVIERTIGKWIIEASDLAGKRKADVEHLKSIMSRQVDGPARMAYAHVPVERARQFIIIGTTNSSAYLSDMTGARRFWPVKITRFNVEQIIKDRDQLWAEAAHREANEESIRLPEALWPLAGAEQEARREVDAWEFAIEEHLQLLQPDTTGCCRVATSKIWEILNIEMSHRDRFGAIRIAEIMQRLGYTKIRFRVDGIMQVGYRGPVDLLGENKD